MAGGIEAKVLGALVEQEVGEPFPISKLGVKGAAPVINRAPCVGKMEKKFIVEFRPGVDGVTTDECDEANDGDGCGFTAICPAYTLYSRR